MVLQSHRAILVRIDHGILPRKGRSPDRSRDEPRGTLKGVPIKVRIGNTNALRDVRLLSISTFAEIMSRENLRRAPPPSLMGRMSAGHMKKPDLLRMRLVEYTDRFGGGLQQYLAAFLREISLSIRR